MVPRRTAPVLRLSESETLLMLCSAAAGFWLGNRYRVYTRTRTIKFQHDNTLSRPEPTVRSKIVRMIMSIFFFSCVFCSVICSKNVLNMNTCDIRPYQFFSVYNSFELSTKHCLSGVPAWVDVLVTDNEIPVISLTHVSVVFSRGPCFFFSKYAFHFVIFLILL